MAVVVAEGVVVVTASADGLPKQIAEQVEGESHEPVKKAGSKVGTTLFKGVMVSAGVAVAGVATLLGGAAITGGFSRLMGIENAQAKLTGLGHSAETVALVMDNALGSVKGTAFGLADAAGVAAGAVAAGVKPGEDLQRVLTLVADAATIAGTDLGTMGSIFNKVAASGKLQGDVIAQLQDSGVPILQMVAGVMGVTAEEAAKLASDGKVSFEVFAQAMQEGLGGAALESGNTTQGAFANMGAALSRVGANLLTGVFPMFKEVFGGIMGILEPLEGEAKNIGAGLSEWLVPALKNGVDLLRDTVTWVGDNIQLLGFLGTIVGTVAIVWGTLTFAIGAYNTIAGVVRTVTTAWTATQWSLNSAMLANPIGLIIIAIAALVAGIMWVATQTTFFQDAWAWMTEVVGTAWDWLWTSVLEPVFNFIGDAFNWIWSEVIEPVVGFITLAIEAWGATTQWLWDNAISPVIEGISAAFKWLWDVILFPIITLIMLYIGLWAGIITWLWENVLSPVLGFIGAAFEWLWGEVIERVVGFINLAIEAWGLTMTLLWESVISPVLGFIGAAFQWVYDSVIAPVVGFIKLAIEAWGLTLQWLNDNVVQPILAGIGAAFEWVYNEAIMPVVGLIDLAIQAWGATLDWLYGSVVKPVLDGVGAAFRWVYDSVIKPVSDAITGALEWVGRTVRDVFEGIPKFIAAAFQSVLGVVRGPINGIIGMVNNVIGALNSVSITIPDWVPIVGGQKWGLSLPLIPMLAQGTNNAPDAFIAGEEGPELITGARGATVRPYSATSDLLAGAARGGGDTYVERVVIDAKNVREFNDVVDMVKSVTQVARAGRGTSVRVGS